LTGTQGAILSSAPVRAPWCPGRCGNDMKVGFHWEDGTFMWYRYLMETTPAPACRWNVMSTACPTRQVLGRIADKWTMLVISALSAEDVLRFSELRRRVEGVTQKVLTQTLRGLERD